MPTQFINDGSVSVSNTSVQVLEDAQGRRQDFFITNPSTTTRAWLHRGVGPAVAGQGIPIDPGATVYDSFSGKPPYQGPLQVIMAAAGATDIAFSEMKVVE